MKPLIRYLALLTVPLVTARADFPNTFTRVGPEYRLSLGAYDRYYFGFQRTTDLQQQFTTIAMALGMPAPTFGYTPGSGELQGFLRAEAIDMFAPNDTDDDGIDDVWELKNGLDPVAPADALLPNATNPAKTNLQYYRDLFGLSHVTDYYSREVSIENHPFAISGNSSTPRFRSATTSDEGGQTRGGALTRSTTTTANRFTLARQMSACAHVSDDT